MVNLSSTLVSLKKLTAFMIVIVVLTVSTILFFELFVAQPINLPTFMLHIADIAIIFVFGLTAIYFLARTKKLLESHIGVQAATVLQFFLLAIASITMTFGVLGVFGVPFSTLLTGAGIISVTVGLIISTFVGRILSGLWFLRLTSSKSVKTLWLIICLEK